MHLTICIRIAPLCMFYELHVWLADLPLCCYPYSILREVQAQLSADLSDKVMALEIDSECADLTNTSSTIAFHSDPTRIKKG